MKDIPDRTLCSMRVMRLISPCNIVKLSNVFFFLVMNNEELY